MEKLDFFPENEYITFPELDISPDDIQSDGTEPVLSTNIVSNEDEFPSLIEQEESPEKNIEISPSDRMVSVFDDPVQTQSPSQRPTQQDSQTITSTAPRVGVSNGPTIQTGTTTTPNRNGVAETTPSTTNTQSTSLPMSTPQQNTVTNQAEKTSDNKTLYNKGTITSSGRIMMPKVGTKDPINKSFSAIQKLPENRVRYI